MEIILKRIAKKQTYTIGRMYLFDGEAQLNTPPVQRVILPGKHLDDKRITDAREKDEAVWLTVV